MDSDAAPPPHMMRVKRELVVACLTCPICNGLLSDATTVSECLHTFCRKCIFEKLVDEEADCCPVCDIDLGPVAIEKLRPDHNLEDVRAKIFPYKRKKIEAHEVVPSIMLPSRRKERSLSSLVVSGPRVRTKARLTGRRTKTIARRGTTLRQLGPSLDAVEDNKGGEIIKACKESSSSPNTSSKTAPSRKQQSETPSRVAHSKKQGSSKGKLFNRTTKNEIYMPSNDSLAVKSALWRPLNCLVEAANRTKVLKSSPKSEGTNTADDNSETDLRDSNDVGKVKICKRPHRSRVEGDRLDFSSIVSKEKARRVQRVGNKKKGALRPSPQALVDAASVNRERRIGPLWFSLLANIVQEGNSPLPQLSGCYIRIKDGNLPVCFIQKYLGKKFDMTNEAEVEIACCGQPVSPTLPVRSLVDLWIQAAGPQKVPAAIGGSAKEFVMVLSYSRKAPDSAANSAFSGHQ